MSDIRRDGGQLWNITVDSERGRWIKGDGTLQNPLTVTLPPVYEAAPELLVQLKQCLRLIEDESLDELHGDLAENVRDAIAKATMEQRANAVICTVEGKKT